MPDNLTSNPGFRRYFVIAVFGAFLLAGSKAVIAKQGDASAFIRNLGHQAVSVLQSHGKNLDAREKAFRKLLAEKFDLTLIGRFSLGRYWRRASATSSDAARSRWLRSFFTSPGTSSTMPSAERVSGRGSYLKT